MIECIVVVGDGAFTADTETIYARKLLERTLRPWQAKRLTLPTSTLTVAIESFLRSDQARSLAPSAQVLWLANDQLLPAPGCIAALKQALDEGIECAWACDATACGPADYLTLRGLERFVAERRNMPFYPAKHSPLPLLMLARMEALRSGRWLGGVRLPSAWVHDFSGYRKHARQEILALLPKGCRSLLDVGGANGAFLQSVKTRLPNCRTVLVEASESACILARAVVDRVWQGDFLQIEIDERFDGVTFLDVLEHVPEPAAMLAKAREVLCSDGFVIASIPNVGHWSVVADLLEGRWDYAPAGIHCVTHVRFFTRRSIAELFEEAGFSVERWAAARLPPPPWFDPSPMGRQLEIDAESLSTVAWHCLARRV